MEGCGERHEGRAWFGFVAGRHHGAKAKESQPKRCNEPQSNRSAPQTVTQRRSRNLWQLQAHGAPEHQSSLTFRSQTPTDSIYRLPQALPPGCDETARKEAHTCARLPTASATAPCVMFVVWPCTARPTACTSSLSSCCCPCCRPRPRTRTLVRTYLTRQVRLCWHLCVTRPEARPNWSLEAPPLVVPRQTDLALRQCS